MTKKKKFVPENRQVEEKGTFSIRNNPFVFNN